MNSKKQEFKELRAGKIVSLEEGKRLQRYWKYDAGYDTVVEAVGKNRYRMTITSNKPKIYGW